MPFVVVCAVVSFIVQSAILFEFRERYQKLPFLSLAMLELLPVGGAFYYAIKRPSVPYLGWEFNVVMCLWVAGAVLLGYLLAWVVYAIKRK